jgi:hypothetical protein
MKTMDDASHSIPTYDPSTKKDFTQEYPHFITKPVAVGVADLIYALFECCLMHRS